MRKQFQFAVQGVVVLFALFVLLAVPTYAQEIRGDIEGKVVDEQGRVVPGATVTATNKGTGASRTTTTNDSGEYSLSNLEPWRSWP